MNPGRGKVPYLLSVQLCLLLKVFGVTLQMLLRGLHFGIGLVLHKIRKLTPEQWDGSSENCSLAIRQKL